ncbi:hypothetical protein FRC04_001660 [Tulasnella sp. 424]|nr:hypothetical protein FRC04_001660 [Tulasnella sp. 424]KAG8971107.1 hypothetical protein FRC05_011476 [Tulasnella sp. 425]
MGSETDTEKSKDVLALIGGFPTQDDFIPSVVLIILFSFSLSPWIKRQYDPDTRTMTLGSATALSAMSQILLYAFRQLEAHRHEPGEKMVVGMLIYEQMGFAAGYMGIMLDLVAFARATLVNATLEDSRRGSKDRPTLRGRLRWILWYPAFTFCIASPLTSLVWAGVFQGMRYVFDSVALITILGFAGGLVYLRPRLEFVDTSALDAIVKLSLTLAIIPTYRLNVLNRSSPTLDFAPIPPYPPGSLTATPAKVIFYIFHALPEALVISYILCTNIRAKFNTGPYGDWFQDDAKHGIPQLREDGVVVEGVGVPPVGQPQKPTLRWWLRFFLFWESRPSRNMEKDEFDPDKESLLTLVPTRSITGVEADKAWW